MSLDFTGLTGSTPTRSPKIAYKSVLSKRQPTILKNTKTPENGRKDASTTSAEADIQLAETLRLIEQNAPAEQILLPALLALRHYTNNPELTRILG